ncbi:DNA mismatch repair endonuclease MutL [Haloferacaceae archaeon DSL9]
MTERRPSIRALDDRTVQRIAAGEVVERPASVVKELVENSLDADASRVSVAVTRGGKESIRVRDDGRGIAESELSIAIEEHTTSKIADIDDLEAGVGTLGFRGEALSTIAAVSRLTIRSRPRDEPDAGAELTVDGGEAGDARPAGCPHGTTVEIEDLFYNTPARKKFLKQDSTEFDHVNTVVTQYALANPDVAVSLEHNGREVFATDGSGDLRAAVLAVYGREVAESMIRIDRDGDDCAEPVGSIAGLVSHPETTRSTREYLATFVNGRYVTAAALREPVIAAYGGQLAPDRYPFAVLFVGVPPAAVDVNAHPRKLDVRFDEEEAVRETIENAVEAALLDHGLIRSTAPRGRSAPAETPVRPDASEAGGDVVGGAGTAHERASDVAHGGSRRGQRPTRLDRFDGETAPSSEAPATADEVSKATSGESDARATNDGPDARAKDDDTDAASRGADAGADDAGADDPWAVDGLDGSPPTESDATPATDSTDSPTSDAASETAAESVPRPSPRRWQADFASARAADAAAESTTHPGRRGGAATQQTLDGARTTDARPFESLPSLRVLGQLYETYVVAEADAGLVLIDQHAADERVNYERLRRRFDADPTAQALASPASVELTAREAALFDEHVEALAQLGFRTDRREGRRVVVESVPAVFDAALDPDVLRDVLVSLAETAEGSDNPVDAIADDLLADLACYPSVTGNTSLTEGSIVDLLEALDDCENPYACPHGRPVIIEFAREDLEDRFERDYPGHVGRRSDE